jgi:hypothetical protein
MPGSTIRGLQHGDQILCPACRNGLGKQEDELLEEEVIYCANCCSTFEVLTDPFELRRSEDDSSPPDIDRRAA